LKCSRFPWAGESKLEVILRLSRSVAHQWPRMFVKPNNDAELGLKPIHCRLDMEEPEAQHIDRGKERAHHPTKRTRSTSTILSHPEAAPQRLLSKLATVFLVLLSKCILGFIGAGLSTWSYASRVLNMSLDEDLVFSGPDRVGCAILQRTGWRW